MGNHLHVAKKYEVNYDSYENFNWKIMELHDFLSILDVPVFNQEGVDYPLDFEITKDEWSKGIKKLKYLFSADITLDEHEQEKKDYLAKSLNDLGASAPEMIEIMDNYLAKADPKLSYLYFSFF